MFIGHYGVALALKKFDQKLSLGLLIIAVQLVDIAFFFFLPLGIENARVVPGFTEASPFDLYDYPFTHSLVGSLAWAIMAILVVLFVLGRDSTGIDSDRRRAALIIGVGVLSHYFLDLLVHTPDLLLIPGIDIKIGLGLWNSLVATVVLELAILLVGGLMYFQSTVSGAGLEGKYGMPFIILVLIFLTITTPFMSFPDMLAAAFQGEFVDLLLPVVAFWLDGKRTAVV